MGVWKRVEFVVKRGGGSFRHVVVCFVFVVVFVFVAVVGSVL